MPYHDSGGMILWIPIFLLVGIVYAARQALKKFGVSTGRWSSFDIVWFGIQMILGFAYAALFTIALVYGGIGSIPEFQKLLNSNWDVKWYLIVVGLLFWYLVVGTVVLYLWNIYKLIRSKLKR